MEFGYAIGFVGLAFGVCVPIPQIIKIVKTKSLNDISVGTYVLLVFCLSCYLIHAIYIESIVFTCAQAFNLCTNGIILLLLVRDRRRRKYGGR